MSISTQKAAISPALPITPLVTHPIMVVFESLFDVILPESPLVENFRWHYGPKRWVSDRFVSRHKFPSPVLNLLLALPA